MAGYGQGRLATRKVVDDFGTLHVMRRCPTCSLWKPQGMKHFSPRKRDPDTRRVLNWDAWCRPCRNARQRAYYDALDQERKRALAVRSWERVKEDPEAWERRRAANREAMRRAREADPDGQREIRRRSYRKVMSDPQRSAAQRESRRISYRLRREREAGVHLDEIRHLIPREHYRRGDGGVLPVAPLVPFVERFLAHHADEAEALSVLQLSRRKWYRWRHEGDVAQFDHLDHVMVALGLHPWDVWAPQDDSDEAQQVYVRALALWGFDVEVAVA